MHREVESALAEARALGFLGPGPLEAHEHSAAAFIEALGTIEGRALDLGSGGGVPGLLLAAHYVDVRWVLLDANRRRTSFLARAVASLGWGGRVEVRRAQAEAAAHEPELRAEFSAVVTRSFGPPALTAECAAGFLAPDGLLAVAEPPEPQNDRWDENVLQRELGLARIGGGRIALFRSEALAPTWAPRALLAMQRHPLW